MEYPDYVVVSGFPLYQMGWNGIYKKIIIDDHEENKFNVQYHLQSYFLFNVLEIVPVYIGYCSHENTWIMNVIVGNSRCTAIELLSDELPFGKWTGGVNIKPHIIKEIEINASYPKHVKVSGFPLWHTLFNGIYENQNNLEYVLLEQNFGIAKRSTIRIVNKNGTWVIVCDSHPDFVLKKQITKLFPNLPIGQYTEGLQVEAHFM